MDMCSDYTISVSIVYTRLSGFMPSDESQTNSFNSFSVSTVYPLRSISPSRSASNSSMPLKMPPSYTAAASTAVSSPLSPLYSSVTLSLPSPSTDKSSVTGYVSAGSAVGCPVGASVGSAVGCSLGVSVGSVLGCSLGVSVGASLGC